MTKFVCEKCAHEIGGMPPYERFKAFCPNCKKLAWFTPKKLNQTTNRPAGQRIINESDKETRNH